MEEIAFQLFIVAAVVISFFAGEYFGHRRDEANRLNHRLIDAAKIRERTLNSVGWISDTCIDPAITSHYSGSVPITEA